MAKLVAEYYEKDDKLRILTDADIFRGAEFDTLCDECNTNRMKICRTPAATVEDFWLKFGATVSCFSAESLRDEMMDDLESGHAYQTTMAYSMLLDMIQLRSQIDKGAGKECPAPAPDTELLELGKRLEEIDAEDEATSDEGRLGSIHDELWNLRERINAIKARTIDGLRVVARAAEIALRRDKAAENSGPGSFVELSRSLIRQLLAPQRSDMMTTNATSEGSPSGLTSDLPPAWIVESVRLDQLQNVTEAMRLHGLLDAELNYRLAFLPGAGDEIHDAISDAYSVRDAILRRIVEISAHDLEDIHEKMRAARNVIGEGDTADELGLSLLESARQDLSTFQLKQRTA